MAKRGDAIGTVIEVLGAGNYKVELEDGRIIIAYLGGRIKRNNVRVGLQDKVEVLLDPAGGHATNRITWRR